MNDGQPFQIDDPNYSISGLRTEHSELLQKLCERCADYVLIVEGESVSPNAAQELLQDTPPGRSLDNKFVYGILDRQGDVVGVLEGMCHYPEENVWWIGLLMLAPEARGCGIGRKVVQSFFEFVRSQQGTAVMLGVVEENRSAYKFWQQMGFELVRQTEQRPFGRKTQSVYVMRKNTTFPGRKIRMVTIVVLILTGLVLLRGVLRHVPGLCPTVERFAAWLSDFDVVIGIIAIVVGILQILSLEGILLVLAGLILAVSALRTIPSVGPSLARLGNALHPFRAVFGVIILLVGVLDLLNTLFGFIGRLR